MRPEDTAAAGGDTYGFQPQPEETLRDYFACRALPAVYAACPAQSRLDSQAIAMKAYELADAMLKARSA